MAMTEPLDATQPKSAADICTPLGRDAAGRLDKRIRLMATTVRENLCKVSELVEQAKAGQIHLTLGFKSWPAYLADALGGQLELGADTRRAVVGLLAGEGMSNRAIGVAVGVNEITVRRDRDAAGEVRHDVAPAVDYRQATSDELAEGNRRGAAAVTGLDGKSYPAEPQRKPKPEPTAEPADTTPADTAPAATPHITVKRDNPTLPMSKRAVGKRRTQMRRAMDHMAMVIMVQAQAVSSEDYPMDPRAIGPEQQKLIEQIRADLKTIDQFLKKAQEHSR